MAALEFLRNVTKAAVDECIDLNYRTPLQSCKSAWQYMDLQLYREFAAGLSIASYPTRSHGYHWMFTPIDSWFNCERGIREWAASSMEYMDAKPLAAYLYLPHSGEDFFVSSSMKSIRYNKRALSVVKRVDTQNVVVALNSEATGLTSYIIRSLQDCDYYRYVMSDSVGTIIAKMLKGEVHAYATTEADYYKISPLLYLCEKAGFVVTDSVGDTPTPLSRTIVIGINNTVHDNVLRATIKF